ncbi:hypothetical protein HGRIS_014553 [Hohenbuehelia grisea]
MADDASLFARRVASPPPQYGAALEDILASATSSDASASRSPRSSRSHRSLRSLFRRSREPTPEIPTSSSSVAISAETETESRNSTPPALAPPAEHHSNSTPSSSTLPDSMETSERILAPAELVLSWTPTGPRYLSRVAGQENLILPLNETLPDDMPPQYVEAQRPTHTVKYTFSPIGKDAMILVPPADEPDSRPKYHISVSMNCFVPSSFITTIRRGGTEEGEFVSDFE